MPKPPPESLTPTMDNWQVVLPNTPETIMFLEAVRDALLELEQNEATAESA